MADRIEELGRAKEGVLVTYRVAFDDGSTSIIEPSKHAIAYAWQIHTHLGKLMDQAAFRKNDRVAVLYNVDRFSKGDWFTGKARGSDLVLE